MMSLRGMRSRCFSALKKSHKSFSSKRRFKVVVSLLALEFSHFVSLSLLYLSFSLSLKKKKKKKMRRRTPEFISFDRLRFDLFKQVYNLILKP